MDNHFGRFADDCCGSFALTELLVTYGSNRLLANIIGFGFGAALAATLACPLPSNGWMRPFHYLGEISYGLYLWHLLVLLSLLHMTTLRGQSLLWVILMGTIALASLSWHLMEKHWLTRSGH